MWNSRRKTYLFVTQVRHHTKSTTNKLTRVFWAFWRPWSICALSIGLLSGMSIRGRSTGLEIFVTLRFTTIIFEKNSILSQWPKMAIFYRKWPLFKKKSILSQWSKMAISDQKWSFLKNSILSQSSKMAFFDRKRLFKKNIVAMTKNSDFDRKWSFLKNLILSQWPKMVIFWPKMTIFESLPRKFLRSSFLIFNFVNSPNGAFNIFDSDKTFVQW